MKRDTFFIAAIVALLLLNLGTLGYLTFRPERPEGPPPPPRGEHAPPQRIDHLIVSSLRLTPDQEVRFDSLKQQHHETMMMLDANYEATLKHYFHLLATDPSESAGAVPPSKDTLEWQLAQIQREKAAATFYHFKQLRDLCKPDQLAAFDSLLPRLMTIIAPAPQEFPPAPTEGMRRERRP